MIVLSLSVLIIIQMGFEVIDFIDDFVFIGVAGVVDGQNLSDVLEERGEVVVVAHCVVGHVEGLLGAVAQLRETCAH